jgi:hypothetical protein
MLSEHFTLGRECQASVVQFVAFTLGERTCVSRLVSMKIISTYFSIHICHSLNKQWVILPPTRYTLFSIAACANILAVGPSPMDSAYVGKY